jgi:hypothetical protein
MKYLSVYGKHRHPSESMNSESSTNCCQLLFESLTLCNSVECCSGEDENRFANQESSVLYGTETSITMCSRTQLWILFSVS